MAKRRGREFFEVFKPENRPQGGHGTASPPGQSSIPSVNRDFTPPEQPKRRQKAPRSGKEISFTLSRMSAIAGALLLIVLLALSHAWGVSRGRGEAPEMRAQIPPADEMVLAGESGSDQGTVPESPRDEGVAAAPASDRQYVLCIITYPTADASRRDRLIEQLRDRFGETYRGRYRFYAMNVRGERGSLPAVGVGPVESTSAPDARQLREEFRNMDFGHERTPFSSAYYLPVQSN